MALTEWPTKITGPAAMASIDFQQVAGVAVQRAVLLAVVGLQVREAAADLVEQHGAIARGEVRREQAPHILVAAEAVGEDQGGWTVAGDLDVVALADVHGSAVILVHRSATRPLIALARAVQTRPPCAVRRHAAPEGLAQPRPIRIAQPGDGRGDPGPGAGDVPVAIEALVLAPHLESLGLQVDQSGVLPERAQGFQARSLRARRTRLRDPELAHGLEHRRIRVAAAEQVPGVSGDAAAGAGDAGHLGDALRRVGHKEDHQGHRRRVERGLGPGQGLGVADLESDPCLVREAVAGEGDLRRRRVDALHLGRRAALHQQLGEGAVAAADIGPAPAGRGGEPAQEGLADVAAPDAHVGLVGGTVFEADLRRIHADGLRWSTEPIVAKARWRAGQGGRAKIAPGDHDDAEDSLGRAAAALSRRVPGAAAPARPRALADRD
jgi:hypothetical protein